MIQLPLN